MPNKTNKPPTTGSTPSAGSTPSIEERAKTRLDELTATREQVRQQLIAIENQIFALSTLLNPLVTPDTDAPTPPPEPPGTI